MKIDPTGPLHRSELRRSRKAERGRAGEFAAQINPAATDPAPSAAATAVSGISGLLSLQEIEGNFADDAQAAAHGNEILDYLDKLRHDLLVGAIPKDDLHRLAAVVREKRVGVKDPRLAGILDEIELRAEVELAKYDG